jgi:hypothetical protein
VVASYVLINNEKMKEPHDVTIFGPAGFKLPVNGYDMLYQAFNIAQKLDEDNRQSK